MFGRIKLAPGEQGGGVKSRKPGEKADGKSSSSRASSSWRPLASGPLRHPTTNSIDAAIRLQVAREKQFELPPWIQAGRHVGYMSKSSGKLCEVIVERISKAKGEVKIVFAEDREVWKIIPISMILSRASPLKQLAADGGAKSVNELLNSAQTSNVDKSVLLQRVVGQEGPQPENAGPDVEPMGPQPENAGPDVEPMVVEQEEGPQPQSPPPIAVPLVGGMARKVIPDKSITASSYFMNNPAHGLGQMWCTRIDSTRIAWRAACDTVNQCLRWDLGGKKQVTGVLTKGSCVEQHWVSAFTLSYSEDGNSWTRLDTSFIGNCDSDTIEENPIHPPFVATVVKLHPTAWHAHISLRAELLGLPAPVAESDGNAQSGAQAGSAQAGSAQTGSTQAGSVEAGSVEAGSVEVGSVEAGSVEAGSVEVGCVQAGPAEAACEPAGSIRVGSRSRSRSPKH